MDNQNSSLYQICFLPTFITLPTVKIDLFKFNFLNKHAVFKVWSTLARYPDLFISLNDPVII